MMTTNNLQELLKKYYVRRGSQIMFKNKLTLNKLSLEMWEKGGEKGVEPSTLSRVINGKRLFTQNQLKTFCTVLDIGGKEKDELIRAAQADYLKRSDLPLPISQLSPSKESLDLIYRQRIQQSGLFILVGFYIVLFFWWILLFIYKSKYTHLNDGYGSVYALIPFFGGIIGLLKIKKTDQTQYKFHRVILFFSLGLLTWSFGTFIWAYYKFALNIIVAYPSWADLSYVVSWPLWLTSLIYLKKGMSKKTHSRLKDKSNLALVIPIGASLLSYYLLIVDARHGLLISSGGFLKTFLDFYYPLFDCVIITFILHKWNIYPRYYFNDRTWPLTFILAGFALNFIGDLSLNYTSTINTYYQGGGIDFILTTAMFFLSLGINNIDVTAS